jgi:hypothetical protein
MTQAVPLREAIDMTQHEQKSKGQHALSLGIWATTINSLAFVTSQLQTHRKRRNNWKLKGIAAENYRFLFVLKEQIKISSHLSNLASVS